MQHNSGVTMDLRALRHFVRLADVLNFSRAAEQCAVTPSTLSREINRLEEECGAPLFERHHHSVSLTPRGQEFLSFARTVESAWREFRNSGTEKSLSGVIKVYCSVTASYLILPEILTLFRREYPDVEITLETGDAANAVQKIEDMDADVAVAARPDHEPGRVVFKSLKEVPLVFICPKSYEIRKGPLDFGIIRGYPFILPQMGMLRKRTLQWFHERGINPKIYAEVGGNEAIVNMVALGFGAGVVPSAVLHHTPAGKDVTVIPVRGLVKPFDVSLCTLRRRLSESLISAFWQTAGNAIRKGGRA